MFFYPPKTFAVKFCWGVETRRATMKADDVCSDAHVKRLSCMCARRVFYLVLARLEEDDDKRAEPSANQSSRWYRTGTASSPRLLFAKLTVECVL
jgi:hypothetical protein